MYLPVFIGEGKCKMNLGVAYREMEDCMDFIFGLGYEEKIDNDNKILYKSKDGTHVEISIVEIR